jgi:lipoyl(octanoyl) transferase
VASMEAELGEKLDIEAIKEKILKHFKTLFEVAAYIAP